MKTPKKALSTVRSPINDVCKNTYMRMKRKKFEIYRRRSRRFFTLLVLEMSIGDEQRVICEVVVEH